MREESGGKGTASLPYGRGSDDVRGRDNVHEAIKQVAWEKCGIVRDSAGLREALDWIERQKTEDAETRNMIEVVQLIARCALAREESRGAHYRTDFPEKRADFERHTVIQKHAGIRFR
jgi:L-aspartate oxidase